MQRRKFDACPAGYVPNPEFASTGCIPCPAGKYSTSSYQRPAAQSGQVLTTLTGCSKDCPIGFYCPPASTKPRKCPPGRFGSSKRLGDADCSGACETGYFCPAASTTPRAFACGNESFYCPPASADRVFVDQGFYTVPETSRERTPVEDSSFAISARAGDFDDTRREGQLQCGPGTFCVLGRRLPCPAGVYGASNGLRSEQCTAPCPAGSYCPVGSLRPTLCPAGIFGAETGLSSAACSGLCHPGFWCPAGSTSPMQIPCKAGK